MAPVTFISTAAIIIIFLMSTITTMTAATCTPVPPCLGATEGHLSLTVIDRVANKTLRVKTPFVASCIDQLMSAMTCALGTHLRLLSSSKERPNSHGIIAESDKTGVTWTWPNLTRPNIEWTTSNKQWRATPNSPTESDQFCEIANRGKMVVHANDAGQLQLKFRIASPLCQQISPSEEMLPSPTMTSQHERASTTLTTHYRYNTRHKQQSPNLQPSSLPKRLSPAADVFHYAPTTTNIGPAIVPSTSTKCHPLSPTAPVFRYTGCHTSPLLTATTSVLSPLAPEFLCLSCPTVDTGKTSQSHIDITNTMASTTATTTIDSLKEEDTNDPTTTTSDAIVPESTESANTLENCAHPESTIPNANTSKSLRKVQFPPDDMLVTSIAYHPRTCDDLKSDLYYSRTDIHRFKSKFREHSALEPVQQWRMKQRSAERLSNSVVDSPSPSPSPSTDSHASASQSVIPPPLSDTKMTSTNLHDHIARDAELFNQLGWKAFVQQRRSKSDFASLDNVEHPAQRLLKFYKQRGAPVKFRTKPWSHTQISAALSRGAHRSCLEHLEFLHEEFVDMIQKSQWVILPAKAVQSLPGLRVSPPGVVPQRERRPRWICDYSWSQVNEETLPLAALEAMQFGHALDRILREIILADPSLGPVQLMKVDLSDGFYRINLNIDDIPKLGVVFPTKPGEEPLVAFPLVLPMGWKNSPPIFSTATETIADLANQRLQSSDEPAPHPLDDRAELVIPENPLQVPVTESQGTCTTATTTAITITSNNCNTSSDMPVLPKPVNLPSAVDLPIDRDPSLPSSGRPLSYVDIFVDDFIGLAQEYSNSRRVRRILLHAIDDVFRPLDSTDSPFRRQPASLKKLDKGDCSWSTVKVILGWIIDTASMTVHLPPHRIERLAEILASIPVTQKRTSVRKWHKVLGELRSMSLALPGSRHLFSHMQYALSNKLKSSIEQGGPPRHG